MDVSIIIVNYNTLKLTKECLDSVFFYTKDINFEVILVDNASTDGSKPLFENDSRIIYIYSEENLGFGKANNLGYERSSGKYIFLLNSDTLLIENSVLKFYKFMEQYSNQYKIGACGCRLTDENGKIIHSYGFFPSIKDLFKDTFNFIKSILNLKKISREKYKFNQYGFIYVDYITGADIFIKKEIIENFNHFFDPQFFMYYEETDLQYRMGVLGSKRCIIDKTKIIHLEGKSMKNKDIKKTNYYKKYKTMILPSMFYYVNKNFSRLYGIMYLCLFNILILPRILVKKMSLKERFSILGICLKKTINTKVV